MNVHPRLLVLGAHPDDAEFHGGGLASVYRQLGYTVKLVSVTNGAAGHHWRSPDELVALRRQEAANAGAIIGAEYVTWEFSDGSLEPTLEVRARIIEEIRRFGPDLVLTHRTCDYHPDHRAVGQCVQDASYMVTVPHVVPAVEALRKDPVVAFLPDLFTRPAPMRLDVVLDITTHLDPVSRMLACHRSQLFEWLAYHEGVLETVPESDEAKIEWVRQWFEKYVSRRSERYRRELVDRFGESVGGTLRYIEMFEVSEYARQPDAAELERLFPQARFGG